MTEIGPGAVEIASYAAHRMGLRSGLQAILAQCIQEMVDQGRLVGKVVTGDHDEDGKTVRDWTEFVSK